MLSAPLSGIWNTAKQIPTTLVSIVVAVVACCFMTADFESVKNLFLGLFQADSRDKIVRAKRLLIPSLGKMVKAYILMRSDYTLTADETMANFSHGRESGIVIDMRGYTMTADESRGTTSIFNGTIKEWTGSNDTYTFPTTWTN